MIPSKKVLIVDDDAQSRQLVRKVLKKLDFLDFIEAQNGKEAIQMAHDERPDLVLMDILMPGIDGYQACREIKNNPLLKNVIVIFMTAVSMEEIDDNIIQSGGDDVLRKPVDASELYFRVKNYLTLITPFKNTNAEVVDYPSMRRFSLHSEIGSIHLEKGIFYDPKSKNLRNKSQYIPLMKQEILLLEAFIHYKNQVLSYEQLLHVITTNGESTIANLRTLVKLLRRKTYKDLIKTLPSIGYKLVI